MTKLITALLLGVLAFSAVAQDPTNTKMVLAQDDMRLKNYRAATRSIHWLLTHKPEYSKSVYIWGYKAYERSAEKSSDAAEKAMLLDSMITIYELKEQRYGLSEIEKNNLAFRYYKYYRNDVEKLEKGLKRYAEVYQSPNTVINPNLASYMVLVRNYDKQVRTLRLDEITNVQEAIVGVIEQKLAAGEDKGKMARNAATIDQIFSNMITGRITCEYLQQVAGKMGNDLKIAKRVVAWSLEASCAQEDFFTDALEVVVDQEKKPGPMKILARRAAAAGRYDEAIKWYKESLPVEENDARRAKTQMEMARIYALDGDKPASRTAAFKAMDYDAAQSAAAQSFVANLYMGSFNDCAEEYNVVEDRAVYMAAYDLFKKAGDVAGMQAAQSQFPTRSEAHTANRSDGESIDVGCWIKVKTTVKTRASQ